MAVSTTANAKTASQRTEYGNALLRSGHQTCRRKIPGDVCDLQSLREKQRSIPKEVEEFFAGKEPDEAGVVVNLKPSEKGPVQEYHPEEYDTIEGFEVDLRKLPPDVKIIRFINSY
jgi:hypothetical protein